MNRTLIPYAVIAGLALLLAASCSNLRDANRQRSISKANVRALVDTIQIVRVGGESAASLMALQKEIDTDSIRKLGGALGQALRDRDATVRALQGARFSFDSLVGTHRADTVIDTVIAGDSVRVAAFTIVGPPIEGTVRVFSPLDLSLPVDLHTQLRITPFDVVYVVGCDAQRGAVVALEAPSWVNVGLVPGEVSPDICHPQTRSFFSLSPDKAVWGVVAAVATYLLVR